MLLCDKDVLDSRTRFGSGGIGALALHGKRLSRCAAEVDFRYQPRAQDGPLVLLAAIGGIRPDRAASVGRIDQVRQFAAIVAGGITGAPRADKAVSLVDADVRFIAEHGRGDLGHEFAIGAFLAAPALERPARVTILLRELCRLGGPVFRNAAALDQGALFVGHALTRSADDACIDDLPAHGQIAQTSELGVEASKQGIDSIGAHQGLAEPPDRRLVRRVVAIVETEEAPEAAPVEDLELSLRIRQAVERLQDQGLEHHHRVQRQPPALAAVRSLQGRIQRGAKYLKVDQRPEPF